MPLPPRIETRVPGLPTCAKCCKPVDRLEAERDPYCRQTIYIAYCHGEHEEVRLNDQLLEAAMGPDMNVSASGVAFAGTDRELEGLPDVAVLPSADRKLLPPHED